MGVRSERDERLGRGPESDIVAVLLTLTDDLSQVVGHGEDQMKVGHWQPVLPPRCQPHRGVMRGHVGQLLWRQKW
jgi:hypothetical protein